MPMNVITRLSNMGHAGADRQVINMKRNHVLCVRVGDGIAPQPTQLPTKQISQRMQIQDISRRL